MAAIIDHSEKNQPSSGNEAEEMRRQHGDEAAAQLEVMLAPKANQLMRARARPSNRGYQ